MEYYRIAVHWKLQTTNMLQKISQEEIENAKKLKCSKTNHLLKKTIRENV